MRDAGAGRCRREPLPSRGRPMIWKMQEEGKEGKEAMERLREVAIIYALQHTATTHDTSDGFDVAQAYAHMHTRTRTHIIIPPLGVRN